jgi:heme/copper-type cytochrome/quinol oxidase subunit 2
MQRLILSTLLLLALVNPVMAADPRVIEVILDSYSITPDHIVVKVNEPVTLKVTNKATLIPHDLIIKAPEAGIDVAVNLGAGKSGEATFTPTRTGTYEMLCDKKLLFFKSHKDKGMHGMLVVE